MLALSCSQLHPSYSLSEISIHMKWIPFYFALKAFISFTCSSLCTFAHYQMWHIHVVSTIFLNLLSFSLWLKHIVVIFKKSRRFFCSRRWIVIKVKISGMTYWWWIINEYALSKRCNHTKWFHENFRFIKVALYQN